MKQSKICDNCIHFKQEQCNNAESFQFENYVSSDYSCCFYERGVNNEN